MSRALFDVLWLGCGLMMIAAIGCGRSTKPADSATTPQSTSVTTGVAKDATLMAEKPTPNSDSATVATEKQLELRETNWEQAQAVVAEHKGKVVVVDVWSTSCDPCLEEFPHLVAMQTRHPADVVCVSFNCDFIGAKNKPVDYYRERVTKALTELQAAGIINLMSNVAADDLFQQLDLDSIPAVYVFDRAGQLAKRFDNRTPVGGGVEGISYEKQIAPLVSELVKASQP